MLVETGEPQELPGGCGNKPALFVELSVNLSLFIACLFLFLALLFALLSGGGVGFCGHRRDQSAPDVMGKHPLAYASFLVEIQPAASWFHAHCATPFVHPRLLHADKQQACSVTDVTDVTLARRLSRVSRVSDYCLSVSLFGLRECPCDVSASFRLGILARQFAFRFHSGKQGASFIRRVCDPRPVNFPRRDALSKAT